MSRVLDWLRKELETAKRRKQIAIEELALHDQKRPNLLERTTTFDDDIAAFEEEIKQQEQFEHARNS
jgi:hypothetical protein